MAKKKATSDKTNDTEVAKTADKKPGKQVGCTEAAIDRIRHYLDERAKTDPLFAEAYSKPGKSIEECMGFICDQVRKSRKTMLTDEEVFGMAVHYYDEDNVKGTKMPSNIKIMCSTSESPTAKQRRKSHSKQSSGRITAHQSAQLSLFD